MRVLIVEDETRMAALIRQGLEEEAYAVDVVADGSEVMDWVRSAHYDLIMLDISIYSPTRADRILPQSYWVHYVFLGFKFVDFELNPMDR